jgi:hypothetical protein
LSYAYEHVLLHFKVIWRSFAMTVLVITLYFPVLLHHVKCKTVFSNRTATSSARHARSCFNKQRLRSLSPLNDTVSVAVRPSRRIICLSKQDVWCMVDNFLSGLEQLSNGFQVVVRVSFDGAILMCAMDWSYTITCKLINCFNYRITCLKQIL